MIALGITLGGEKGLLGLVQTGTENDMVCRAFLRTLLERGLGVAPRESTTLGTPSRNALRVTIVATINQHESLGSLPGASC